jgi:sulfide:quinone oxidoreductase
MSERSPLKVVVAGGGVAAVELVLALHELAGRHVQITLVAPNEELDIRALRTVASLTGHAPPRLPLRRIAVRAHARIEHTSVHQILPQQHLAELGDGRRLPYDALVIATGARPTAAYGDGVATFGKDADGGDVAAAVDDLRAGRAQSVALVVPPGVAWTLPIYELALLMAPHVSGAISIVTPESAPLAIFGPEAAHAAGRLLDAAGVGLHLGAYASVDVPGHIALRPSEAILEADRIIALPHPVGRPLEGVPADADGFVAADDHGRVRGLDGVYAIGDATTFPVKQGGLASQMATAAAATIAAAAGADVVPHPFRPVLRGQLLTGPRTLHLDSPIAGGAGTGTADSRAIWRPAHKVDALYLSRLLEDEPAFASPPVGVDVAIRLAGPSELEREPLALDPYSPASSVRLGALR